MTDNPYRLARDIRGIGFRTADAIAMKLGIAKTAMMRVRARDRIRAERSDDSAMEGHCGLPREEARANGVPGFWRYPTISFRTALDLELAEGTVVADRVADYPLRVPGGPVPGRTGNRRQGCCASRAGTSPGPISMRRRRCRGSSGRPACRWRRARPTRSGWRSLPRPSSSPGGPAWARRRSSMRF